MDFSSVAKIGLVSLLAAFAPLKGAAQEDHQTEFFSRINSLEAGVLSGSYRMRAYMSNRIERGGAYIQHESVHAAYGTREFFSRNAVHIGNDPGTPSFMMAFTAMQDGVSPVELGVHVPFGSGEEMLSGLHGWVDVAYAANSIEERAEMLVTGFARKRLDLFEGAPTYLQALVSVPVSDDVGSRSLLESSVYHWLGAGWSLGAGAESEGLFGKGVRYFATLNKEF